MSKHTTESSRLHDLEAENSQLRAELDALRSTITSRRSINWRSILRWLSLALAGAIFIVGSLVFYFAMTIIDTNRFMNVAAPIGQIPAVQEAVANRASSALYERVDIEQLAQEVLPERVDFLAPEIASQIQNFTQQELQKIIASEGFQGVWQQSLRAAHDRFITGLENYEGDGTIDIYDVYARISERLHDTKLSFLADKNLPSGIGSIVVIDASWLPAAHQVVSNITLYRILTVLLFIGLLSLTIWLSHNRRRAIIHIGVMITSLSVLILISARIVRTLLVNQARPENKEVLLEVWQIFMRPLGVQLVSVALFGMVVVIVAWLYGRSRSAQSVKDRFNLVFQGKLHTSLFGNKENAVTEFVGHYQKIILALLSVIFVLAFLFIDLTLSSIITFVLLMIFLVAVVKVLAAK